MWKISTPRIWTFAECAATPLPHVIFHELVSPRAAGWRGGAAVLCAAAPCSFSPLTGSRLHLPSLRLSRARMDACTCGEPRWSVGRMRSDGTGGVWNVGKWRVLGRRWCLQLETAEICQRVCESARSLVRFLERRNKALSLEWIHSATELTAVLGLVLPNNKTPQSRSSKDRTDSLTGVRVLFLSAQEEFVRRQLSGPICQNGSSTVFISLWTSVHPNWW